MNRISAAFKRSAPINKRSDKNPWIWVRIKKANFCTSPASETAADELQCLLAAASFLDKKNGPEGPFLFYADRRYSGPMVEQVFFAEAYFCSGAS